jgi:hypothetical protein
MLDTHLIYLALTAFGIAAGAGIAVAAAIIAIAGLRHRARRPAGHPVPVLGTSTRRAAAEREPALR